MLLLFLIEALYSNIKSLSTMPSYFFFFLLCYYNYFFDETKQPFIDYTLATRNLEKLSLIGNNQRRNAVT